MTSTYEDGTAAHEDLERGYSERPNVRRLNRDAGRASSSTRSSRTSRPALPAGRAGRRPGSQQNGHRDAPQVALVVPKSFNDAQKVADKLKAEVPVIINLAGGGL